MEQIQNTTLIQQERATSKSKYLIEIKVKRQVIALNLQVIGQMQVIK